MFFVPFWFIFSSSIFFLLKVIPSTFLVVYICYCWFFQLLYAWKMLSLVFILKRCFHWVWNWGLTVCFFPSLPLMVLLHWISTCMVYYDNKPTITSLFVHLYVSFSLVAFRIFSLLLIVSNLFYEILGLHWTSWNWGFIVGKCSVTISLKMFDVILFPS